VLGGRDHVVPVQRGHRDRRNLRQPERAGPGSELPGHLVERAAVPRHQVHLVDDEHHVRHPQQSRDGGVAAALLGHAVPDVHEHDGDVGGRRAGDHVPRVLDVAGGVGEHERPARRREVPVRDVDRDALLALGAQAVREQRPAEQGRFAVVDRPGGGDPQQS
jgi:hypothetical protein